MTAAHLAIDLGASSGRAILGVLQGTPQKLRLEEVHRFSHQSCSTPTGPVWDLTGLWRNLLEGLSAASAWCRENHVELASVGVDTWGVDWALLGPSGELLALPHAYRDPQNESACQRVLEKLGGFEKLYERTGIQLMALNTVFQVAARHEQEPQLFSAAERLVFLPDLFHYWLSGVISTERTIASTSSLLAVETGEWDFGLLEQLELPTHLFGPLVEPGTALGTLRKEVALETGATTDVRVITPAAHDTASAVVAVPATGQEPWAYLSSGTWSLLGAELDRPLSSEVARKAKFTNERGANRSVRFLKNISGLWLLQELRREQLQEGETADFASLTQAAETAEPFRTLINPNYPEFGLPGNMAEKIRAYAKKTSQPSPDSVPQLVRCCLESLALCYDRTLNELEEVLDHRVDVLHLVGGGTNNRLLSQWTAAAAGRPVVCGPTEATAVGNVLVQALGCGEISDLAELRQVVARSFPLERIEASSSPDWDRPRTRYAELVECL